MQGKLILKYVVERSVTSLKVKHAELSMKIMHSMWFSQFKLVQFEGQGN